MKIEFFESMKCDGLKRVECWGNCLKECVIMNMIFEGMFYNDRGLCLWIGFVVVDFFEEFFVNGLEGC